MASPRWGDYEDSVSDVERDESRAARREDRTDYRLIGDRYIDENDVPDLRDVTDA